MSGSKVQHISDAEFAATVGMGQPVLVDFWAEWCNPCRNLGPTIDAIAEEFDGKVIVAKINIDDHQETATRFGVQSIPTVLIFKDGEPVERIVGAYPKATYTDALARVL